MLRCCGVAVFGGDRRGDFDLVKGSIGEVLLVISKRDRKIDMVVELDAL